MGGGKGTYRQGELLGGPHRRDDFVDAGDSDVMEIP